MPQAPEPIAVFDRYRRTIGHEPVFGERWLRWTYETAAGRAALHLLVKRAFFSRLYGWRMNRPGSARLIPGFIATYGIDATELAGAPGSFGTFNEFFGRRLKPEARPIDPDPRAVVFPADGRHLGFSDLGVVEHIYAKGQRLRVEELIGDAGLARRFARGSAVISRLCPTDYHRFHFPCGGRLDRVWRIGGPLFSVNPIAVRRRIEHLVQNKRVVSRIETDDLGTMLMVEIGATCVGTIEHVVASGPVAKGQEKGRFLFGGSCVIALFEPGRVRLAADLVEQTAAGREMFARMGDRMATIAE